MHCPCIQKSTFCCKYAWPINPPSLWASVSDGIKCIRGKEREILSSWAVKLFQFDFVCLAIFKKWTDPALPDRPRPAIGSRRSAWINTTLGIYCAIGCRPIFLTQVPLTYKYTLNYLNNLRTAAEGKLCLGFHQLLITWKQSDDGSVQVVILVAFIPNFAIGFPKVPKDYHLCAASDS